MEVTESNNSLHNENATWNRPRTTVELREFINRRNDLLDVEDFAFQRRFKRKEKSPQQRRGAFFGSTDWDRTSDLRLMSPTL